MRRWCVWISDMFEGIGSSCEHRYEIYQYSQIHYGAKFLIQSKSISYYHFILLTQENAYKFKYFHMKNNSVYTQLLSQ